MTFLDVSFHKPTNKRERFENRKEGKLRGRLLHREERPARERYIIDTSEWTCASYRYVIGQHFGL
jgi:hypothetical protein